MLIENLLDWTLKFSNSTYYDDYDRSLSEEKYVIPILVVGSICLVGICAKCRLDAVTARYNVNLEEDYHELG